MPDQQAGTPPATIACPFCGLGCDDLSPSRSTAEAPVDSHGCLIARTGFIKALSAPQIKPRVDGRDAPLDDALRRIARRLGDARLPLFAGLSGDLADMRGALRLAERTGGALDHCNGDALMTNLSVLEESGWMVTSLGETRNRTDLLVLIGDGLLSRFPRLGERLVQPNERLHTETAATLVQIGPNPGARPSSHQARSRARGLRPAGGTRCPSRGRRPPRRRARRAAAHRHCRHHPT